MAEGYSRVTVSGGLNESQMRAVQARGHSIVLAIPGSGKTRVITERARSIFAADPGAGVALVTFTNSSAKEMTERLRNAIGRRTPGLLVGTFHSHALAQLRHSRINYHLVDDNERLSIIRHAWDDAGRYGSLEDAVKEIESYKSQMHPIVLDDGYADIIDAYQKMVRRVGAIDFQDLLLMAVDGMRSGKVQRLPGRHLMVDEYQDTDELQYEWIRLHAESMEVMVVGDEDQSIYSFRRAMGYVGVTRFASQFSAPIITLEKNYRCKKEILDAAGLLITHNIERYAKEMEAHSGEGGAVSLKAFITGLDEAEGIAAYVGESPKQWAVLSRTNHGLNNVEAALCEAGVPYYRIGGKRLWERRHVATYLSFLESLASGSSVGVEQLMMYFGVKEEVIAQLSSSGPNRLIAIDKLDFQHPKLNARGRAVVAEFRERYPRWRELSQQPHTIDVLVESVADWMISLSDNERAGEDLFATQRVLRMFKGGLKQRIHLLLRKQAEAGEGCALLTMHGAKGLEFDKVWIVRVHEDHAPHKDSIIEEERRLFYVGMTRARKELVLSFAESYGGGIDAGGPSKAVTPSRFIVEAGFDCEVIEASRAIKSV